MTTFTELLFNEMEITLSLFRELDSDIGTVAEEKLAQLRPILNGSLLDSCVTPFVDAEMDFRTSGERGLGRTSVFVPRFGGHFRKRMSKLDSVQLTRIRTGVVRCVISGYLAYAIFYEVVESVVTDAEQLYEKWIPLIYSVDLNELGEGTDDYFLGASTRSLSALKAVVSDLELEKGGFLASAKDPNRTDLIMSYYPAAGFLLRHTETIAMN
jgi:hypothetical protein